MRSVLIIGDEPRVVVTVARSLHKRAIPVIVASLSPGQRKLTSRSIFKWVDLSHYRHTSKECLEAVTELIQLEQVDMLIPSSDSALAWTSKNYEALKKMVYIACPPPAITSRVLDKNITLDIANVVGVPVPTSYVVSGASEIDVLRPTFRFPLIAKPRTKINVGSNTFKVRYFFNFEELRTAFELNPDFGRQNLLQEYFKGEGLGIGALIRSGEPIALFQHRRLRELPWTGGVSVAAISEAVDPMLRRLSIRILRGLEWQGIAMVEFRYDRTNRTAALMEVNGRYWGTLSLAIQAGVDFPFYEWQIAHGLLPTPPSQYAIGRKWRWTTGDLVRLHGLFSKSVPNNLPAPLPGSQLVHFIADFRPSVGSALWSVTDPSPALSEFINTLKLLIVAGAKIIMSRILPEQMLNHLRTSRQLSPSEGNVYLKLQVLRTMGFRRDYTPKLPAEIHSVLFVCHGNIIRSPFAAAMLKEAFKTQGKENVSIASAGLAANPERKADERARIMAKEFGIILDTHVAKQLTRELVLHSDVIFVMDFLNEARLLAQYPYAAKKVFLLSRFSTCSKDMEIKDPYHGEAADIRQCYEIVQSCTRNLHDLLQCSIQGRSGITDKSCMETVS